MLNVATRAIQSARERCRCSDVTTANGRRRWTTRLSPHCQRGHACRLLTGILLRAIKEDAHCVFV